MAQDPGPLEALYETDVQTPGARTTQPRTDPTAATTAAVLDPAHVPSTSDALDPPGAFTVPILPGPHFEAVVSSAVYW